MRQFSKTKASLLGASAMAIISAPQTSHAQQATYENAEIVVTATKSRETISKVPISILAYSADALKDAGIKSVSDLGNLSPGVQFDQVAGLGAGTNTNIAIRGISSSIGTSTTGVYLDDTPLQTRVASLSYFGNPYPAVFDLERVEVDRGPQGTLFGAGAEGGAVRFITAEPSLTKFSGTAHAELAGTAKGGTSYEGGLAVGGPIIRDTLGFRASIWHRRDGGYVDRVDPFTLKTVQANANWNDTLAGRLALLYAPADGVKITPSFFGQVDHNNDSSAFYTYLRSPSSGSYANGRLARQPATERLYLPSLKIEVGLPGDLTATSVTSYMIRTGHGIQDGTSTNGVNFGGYGYNGGDPAYNAFPTAPEQGAIVPVSTDVKTFSQELRIANAPGSRLKWTAGGFYSSAIQTDTQNVYGAWVIDNYINPVLVVPNGGTPLKNTDKMLFSQIRSTDKQVALFGQVDYKITPTLTATVGGRISHTIAGYSQAQSGFLSSTGNNSVAYQSGSQSQYPWSGKLGLTWQATPATMIYGSASRGYRVGGANQPINSAPTSQGGCGITAPPTFGSDQVYSYELGTKGRAAGGKLRFDLSGYYVDWRNIQQSIYFPCAFGYITNSGNAVSKGLDVSLRYDLSKAITTNLAVSYNHSAFTKTVFLPTATPGDPGSLLVSAGDKLAGPGSAPWNITASVDYRFTVAGRDGHIRVEDTFKSHDGGRFPWQNALANLYSPLLPTNPSTNLVNARAAVNFGALEVAVFGNNLFDSHPTLYKAQDNPTSLLFTALTLRPRTVGISLDYHM